MKILILIGADRKELFNVNFGYKLKVIY